MLNKNGLMFKVEYMVEVLRMSAGSWFQACGRAAMEKALEPNAIRDRGTSKIQNFTIHSSRRTRSIFSNSLSSDISHNE